jgi:Nucleoside-diphosphate-sugar pyrophosphorylase involved in lipopolysaccharide biosynthesis/translation initiation factor 2B, gamma/epsilon subunits (eIF-2Bgamma/eIF-2Bepsilon)
MSKDWKQVLLAPEQSLREALNIINNEALRVALVVDKQHRLLGVLTDGDVRRAILSDISLDMQVAQVMNQNPISVSPRTSRNEALALMQRRSILSLPVVDEQGYLLGLDTWETASEHRCYDNPVFIMAGGFGSRLKPLTDHCPKPMLKIGDKPMLEILLSGFIKAGFHHFYISTHYMPECIKDYFGDGSAWGVSIQYVYEHDPLGTGGALGLLPKDIPELPLIMINGDILTSLDFERLMTFHLKHKPAATMCVRQYEYQIPYGVINGDGHRVIDIQEKPIERYFVNAGIYMLSPELFKSVPNGMRIDMPTLLEQKIASNQDVLMFPFHEYWLDIGRMDDFNRAQIDIRELCL